MRWRSAAPGRPPWLPADRVVADGRCPRPEPVMTKAFVTAIGARFEAHGVELVHFGNGLMSWADPSSVTLPRRWPATLARDPRCGEGGGADGELRAASTAAGPGRPTGPARRAAGRQLPGLVPQCHRRPLAGLQQLRPTAHPHRVATLAALAVVGRGRGGRDGRAHAG